MPYRIAWGPSDGSVVVVTETATEAVQIIRDHQDQPKQSAIEIATLEGETLYEADLLERAAAEGHRALAS